MNEPAPAKYLNDVEISITVSLFEVTCLGCGKTFVVEHKTGKYNISAIPCKYCDCAFNVLWKQ